MSRYYVNGIVVQRRRDEKYQGIDSGIDYDAWYLNYIYEKDNELVRGYYKYVDISEGSFEIIEACINNQFIKKYILRSNKLNVDIRLVLCVTTLSFPQYNASNLELEFLGYDYAYPGGIYYSAIYNDIIYDRIKEFHNIKLNKNGLFDSEEELDAFIQKREDLKKVYKKGMFESGVFVKYKLYEIDIESFLNNCCDD
ncbi:hypothetical protein C809_04244 [Lachnospiraceae bacterium MD335]|nr:hypothetical protein C809_04244 [Lachnospiraceae bacterium MD335]